MKEQLKHIFDQSACLSKRQLKNYLSGSITHDECHALEHHVNTCYFCSEALSGIMEHKEDALSTIDRLNNYFLKERFSLSHPNLHLNSIATATSAPAIRRIHKPKPRLFAPKPSAIASGVVLVFAVLWYVQFGKDRLNASEIRSSQLSQQNNKISQKNLNSTGLIPVPYEKNINHDIRNDVVIEEVHPKDVQISESAPIKEASESSIIPEPKTKIITEKKSVVTGSGNKLAVGETKEQVAKPIVPTTDKIAVEQINNKENNFLNDDQNVLPPTAPVVENAYIVNIPKQSEESNNAVITSSKEKMGPATTLFESGKYDEALDVYKTQMNSPDKQTREQASLMAARCYIRMGQPTNASVLLESLANNGNGAQKRQATRLLKDLKKDTDE